MASRPAAHTQGLHLPRPAWVKGTYSSVPWSKHRLYTECHPQRKQGM